jgi:hypothetical protein
VITIFHPRGPVWQAPLSEAGMWHVRHGRLPHRGHQLAQAEFPLWVITGLAATFPDVRLTFESRHRLASSSCPLCANRGNRVPWAVRLSDRDGTVIQPALAERQYYQR